MNRNVWILVSKMSDGTYMIFVTMGNDDPINMTKVAKIWNEVINIEKIFVRKKNSGVDLAPSASIKDILLPICPTPPMGVNLILLLM
jgi:hypothetical protein